MMDTLDDPDALMKRASQLRDVAKFISDTKALTVIEELIAELTSKADALRRRKMH